MIQSARRRRRRLLLIAFLFFIILLLTILRFELNGSSAGTTIPESIITSDTTWFASGSPYWIEGNVTVADGVILTIEAGVEIRFNFNMSLIVEGKLLAMGEQSNLIYFTSNASAPQTAGYWRGLQFNSSKGSIMEYAAITYGVYGISCNQSSFSIINTSITNNRNHSVYLYECSSVLIEDSFVEGYNPPFTGSGVDGGTAVQIESSSEIIISNSTIRGGNGSDDSALLSGGQGGRGVDISSPTLSSSSNISINNSSIFGGNGGIGSSSPSKGWGGTGVYLTNSNNVRLSNSTIVGGNGSASVPSTFNGEGVYMESASNIEILSSTISNGHNNIDVEHSSSATIRNNTILNADAWAIIYAYDSSPLIENNLILNNAAGIWGINFPPAIGNPLVVNNTIDESTTAFGFEGGNNHPISLNTTFNKTKVGFVPGDTTSNLTVQWYMHVKVEDINNKAIAGANVVIKDLNSVVIASGITVASGYLKWIVSTEYIQNDANGDGDGEDPGEKVFFTPHNVTASKDGYIGYADPEPNINESKEVIVKLPVAYTTYTISKDPLQGNVAVDGLQYPAPAIFSWLDGDSHTISVNSPESAGINVQYAFDYWDDLGAQTHVVNVGTVDTIITANYITQYRPAVTLLGTDSAHNVTAYYTQNGLPVNVPGNFNSWSDWCDGGTSLYFDVETTGSSTSERWHTYEDFAISPWISVTSPFSATLVYYHQYNATITTTGLISSYPAIITAMQAGNLLNPSIYTSWNDWIDFGSALSINETVNVSATERFHTIDVFSWTANSPIDATVDYYHQYLVNVTTTGLDSSNPATISVTQYGITNNPTTSTSWEDWVDNSTTTSINDTIMVSGTERYHTVDTVSWFVDSTLSVSVDYYRQYKPSITLTGLDSAHNVTAYHVKDGGAHNDPNGHSSWTDWCDEGTSLSFDIEATGSSASERWHTYEDFAVDPWTSVSSGFSNTVAYYHQYNITIMTTGLISSYPAAITATQAGNPLNPTTYTSWNDWVDADTALSIDETVAVSATERYNTIEAFSWTVNSPIDATVNYYHQYSVTITTTGLDAAFPGTISIVQHGSTSSPTIVTMWSGWADAASALGISEMIAVSATERYHTIDTIGWAVNSALIANVNYYHQYKPTIISIGLSSEHPATVSYTQHGTEYHMVTSSTWSNWSDASSALKITDEVYVSVRERYRTLDNTSWTVNSAFTANVNYIHQYMPIISLVGTDSTHTVGVMHEKDATNHNDTGVHSSWSDWVDENTTLSFDECTSGSPRRCTTDARTWTIKSALDATIRYSDQGVDGVKELNYKPLVALIFSIVLFLVGAYATNKRPLRLKDDEKRNKMFNFLFVVMPFVVIEAITGIVSLLTGFLSIPPLIGPGTIVDLLILISGLIVFLLICRRRLETRD